MRALILAHDDASLAGMIGERLEARGVEVVHHIVCPDIDRPDHANPFPSLHGFDIVIPMGAVWSVYDHDTIGAWIDDEIELLRTAHHTDTAMLGICFGGQALATALGGAVEPSPQSEIGWTEVVSDAPDVIDSGEWFQWHHDRFAIPPCAELLAHNGVGPQMFRIGRTVGTQFHPEVDARHLERWLEYASPDYLASHGVDPDELRSSTAVHEEHARERCNALVDWFLDEVVRRGSSGPTG